MQVYQISIFYLFLLLSQSKKFHFSKYSQKKPFKYEEPKEIYDQRQSEHNHAPLISSFELDAPKILGMGHVMTYAVEKFADRDSNPHGMIAGYDTAMVYTGIGRILPGSISQMNLAQDEGLIIQIIYLLGKGRNEAEVDISNDLSNRKSSSRKAKDAKNQIKNKDSDEPVGEDDIYNKNPAMAVDYAVYPISTETMI